jgi:long-chain fatty acid transport protein
VRLARLTAAASLAAWSGRASADSGIDSPDSGVVQMGRGSAWVARADDPLAAFFNPAAMAFQSSGVHLGGQLILASKCFTRVGPNGLPYAPDPSPGSPAPLLPGQPQPGDGSTLPQDRVCQNISAPLPAPQIAAVFRVHDKVAVGIAVVTPHAAAGQISWGESLPFTNFVGFPANEPSPQRYLLVSSNALILYPTVSVAYAPLDNLSFGAGFVWGIGTLDFVTFSESISAPPVAMPGMPLTEHASKDVKAELSAKDLFIPGVILSGLWMPSERLDLAAWFKWQDAFQSNSNLSLTALYWSNKFVPNIGYCAGLHPPQPSGCNVTNQNDAGTVKFQLPIEAKLGVRYHHPRAAETVEPPKWGSVKDRKVRDPMSQDVFDVELDFTYANNSAVEDIQISFLPHIPIKDGVTKGGVGQVPTNANIPHHWKDVAGIRLGSDVVLVPNRFALRAGGWLETAGQDAQYLNLDFDVAMRGGVAGGATVRAGPVDISVGYQHTFYATLDNHGNGSVNALSGDGSACPTGVTPAPVGPGCFRSYQSVNGGRITANLNEFGLAATARF